MTHYFCPNNGSSVAISPGPKLGGGGEGNIFAVRGMPASVAKILHNPSPEHRCKLEAMLANPCIGPAGANAGVAWPEGLLFADAIHQKLAGYLMPRVNGAEPIVEFYTPKTRRQKCPRFNYRYLVRAGLNLTNTLQVAHRRGYVIGDINESNLLVADNACVTMVDADSWQVRDPRTGTIFRCSVGKPDFTPPELQGKNLGGVNRSELHDRFALAVLLFKLQMEGVHPFDGVFQGSGEVASIEARIAAGHFPHGKRAVPYVPKPLAPPFQILHPKVQALFVRCFEDGHFDPRMRPDERAWHDAIEEAERSFVECSANGQHWYGRHLTNCPWCERASRMGGLDPFPSGGAQYAACHSVVGGGPVPQVTRRRKATTGRRAPSKTQVVPQMQQLVQQGRVAARKVGLPFTILVIGIIWMILFMGISVLSTLSHVFAR